MPGCFALCRQPSRGRAWGGGQLHDLPVTLANLHRFANSRAICVVGDGIQAPSRDAPPSSPPFPGQALTQSGLGHRLVLAGPPEGPPSLTSLFPAIVGPVPLLHGLAGFCLLLKKRAAEDETVGWHHPLSGHDSEQLPEQRRPGQPGLLQPMGRKEPATWLLNTTSRAHRGAGWRSLFTWLSQSAPDTEQDPINKRD